MCGGAAVRMKQNTVSVVFVDDVDTLTRVLKECVLLSSSNSLFYESVSTLATFLYELALYKRFGFIHCPFQFSDSIYIFVYFRFVLPAFLRFLCERVETSIFVRFFEGSIEVVPFKLKVGLCTSLWLLSVSLFPTEG